MRCPICQREFKSQDSSALPFCSERCRTIDLGRWLGEQYPVPATPEIDDEGPESPRETANVDRINHGGC